MKTKHVFEDAYYFISNKAVAKCFMFGDTADCQKFKAKIDLHLQPICDILAYGFMHDEFQLVVKIKDRKTIEKYFISKFGSTSEIGLIPETTYIFAQAMANLQSGYVKHFNFKYERDGGLMKGRYHRRLIESESELDALIESIHELNDYRERKAIWTFRRKDSGFSFKLGKNSVVRSSKSFYMSIGMEKNLSCLVRKEHIYVRGHFDILPPKSIDFKNQSEKFRNIVSFLLMKSF